MSIKKTEDRKNAFTISIPKNAIATKIMMLFDINIEAIELFVMRQL